MANESTIYPAQDGRPLAESEIHRRLMRDTVYGLRQHFRHRNDVYVGGALLMFYEEGNPHRFVAPDVLIAFGVPRQKRENYLVWREGKAPDVVIEFTSRASRTEDLVMKKGLYARLGVSEYYIFDPQREYVSNSLLAFELNAGQYESRTGEPVRSRILNLDLRIEQEDLRLVDVQTGEPLRRMKSEPRDALQVAEEARRSAERRAREADLARERAEARARQVELQMAHLLAEIRRHTHFRASRPRKV